MNKYFYVNGNYFIVDKIVKLKYIVDLKLIILKRKYISVNLQVLVS